MKIIDLSQTLENNMPVYPGDPECKIEDIHKLEKEGWRLKYLQFSSHVGTHVDAPAHMNEIGETLDNLPLDSFFGETIMVKTTDSFPKNIGLAFSEGQIDIEVVNKLKSAKPKFVVVGNKAVLDVEAERQLLKFGIITITDLINTEQLPYKQIFSFYAIPLKIKDGDGSPVRAFAILDKPEPLND